MSHNSFGNLLKFTTWGESHGEALGCVVDGFPAGIPINTKYIQTRLDLRNQVSQNLQHKEKKKMKSIYSLEFLTEKALVLRYQ